MKNLLNINNSFMCPKCRTTLIYNEYNSLKCENNHCYDRAKEGYVNLLLVGMKNSKDPGDNEEMIKARHEFLQKDFYKTLASSIADIIEDIKNINCIVDAGCGTGYFLKMLSDCSLSNTNIGIDISKHAIKTAAKADKNSLYLVASIFNIPLKDNCADIILNIFAPKAEAEFLRILKPNGYVIEVVPGSDHLKELKELIYQDSTRPNNEKFAFSNLQLQKSKRITYTQNLQTYEDIMNLLKMTPYWHKGGKHYIESLNNLTNIEVTFDFIINIWMTNNVSVKI